MSVNPGMHFLADNLDPGGDYPIEVPESGGIIIQGANTPAPTEAAAPKIGLWGIED